MSFPFFKNTSPIVFYFGSIICFVIANVCKESNVELYYGLLGLGLVLFLVGLLNKTKRK